MTAQSRSEIAALLERHGLAPIHRFGQHFLADANITRKVVSVAGVGRGSRVVEVGAGTGTLTRALGTAGATVVAYEIDEGLKPVLKEVTEGLDVELRFGDVMNVDLGTELKGAPWSMVANLPYNVGTPLVLRALRQVPAITRFVVMMQREVAERLVADPGGREYGLPSVVVGIHAEADVSFLVPPQVFYPPPNVESAVVVMDRKAAPPEAERAIELASVAFGQRRKMLRRSLVEPAVSFESAAIDPTLRAEDLSPDDYLRLAAS